MKLLKLSLAIVLNIILVSFGASLTLKAAIGVGAWDSVSQIMSLILGIKVGTFAIFLNSSCVLGQWILLGKNFKVIRLLQVGVAVLLGVFVNFFYYTLLGPLVLESYVLRIVVFVFAIIILAFGVSNIMLMDKVTFPLEALCMVISDKTGLDFGKLRQGADFLSILFALSMSLLFALPFTVREGTVLGMLMFGPLLSLFMKHTKESFKRLDLIDEK
jgi:uncharacterized membrane protein YczE